MNVAASNVSGGQQCVSYINNADPVEDDTTPRRYGIHPASKLVLPLRTAPNMPLLVALDTMLGQSEDDKTHFECRRRTSDTLARRMHSQPRPRAVSMRTRFTRCGSVNDRHGWWNGSNTQSKSPRAQVQGPSRLRQRHRLWYNARNASQPDLAAAK